MLRDLQVLFLFSFTCSDLRYRFIDGKGKGDGKACFLCDALRQLIGPLVASVEFIHSGDVKIKFINRGLFHHRGFLLNDFGNVMGEP